MNLNVVSLHQSHSRASVLKSAHDRSSSFSSALHTNAHTNRTQTRRLNANTNMYSEKINKQITNKARIHSHTHQDKYFNPRFTCPSITNTQVNGLANDVNTLNQLREKKR